MPTHLNFLDLVTGKTLGEQYRSIIIIIIITLVLAYYLQYVTA